MVAGEGYGATHDGEGNFAGAACGYEAVRYGGYFEDARDAVVEERQRRKSTSPPYRRDTYWAERISQWREQEPEIPSSDFEQIEQRWKQFTGELWEFGIGQSPKWSDASWSFDAHRVRRCSRILSKEDCRQILWSIDEELAKHYNPDALSWDQKRIYMHEGIDPASVGKPMFVKKYLVSLFLLFCFLCCALFVQSVLDCLHVVPVTRNAPRHVIARQPVVVALVALKVHRRRFPQQMSRVDAPRMTAHVAALVVLVLRQNAEVQKHCSRVGDAVVDFLHSARQQRVVERTTGALGVGLNQRNDAVIHAHDRTCV